MEPRSRFLRFAGVLGAAAFLGVAGCNRSLERADLVFVNGAEPELLDPALVTAQSTGRIAYGLLEGLACFDAEARPQPGVAERWEVSADGCVYTFYLRESARWSNGDPVVSEDFVYSWRRVLLPQTASEYASQLYPILNAQAFNEGKIKDFDTVGVRALSPRVLEVRLESPTPYFPDLCAFMTYLPVHRKTVETFPDWASRPAHFVGNGPFLLTEWRLFDRVRMTKNPGYWNADAVSLRVIDVLPSSRANTAFNLYSTGEADLMMDKGLAPTALMDVLRTRKDFHASPFLGTYFIRFNCSRGPFADPRVRLACSLVVDRDTVVNKITRAGETQALSFVPPGTGHGYVPPVAPGRNPELARRLLAEAGYPGGKGFPVFDYLFKGDSDLDRDIAVELQSMFQKELGIHMQLRAQEWTVYLASQSALDYDLCRSSWVADYNDPNTFLNMFVSGDGNNRTGWSNPAYDALIARAAKEVSPQRRFEAFSEAEEMLVQKEAPVCPLYFYVGIQFYDPDKLEGIVPNLLDEHPLKYVRWKGRK
ncbi:MAG: peptide ABC transporter substrate-binding protein [Verrucomicrobiota bacterium]